MSCCVLQITWDDQKKNKQRFDVEFNALPNSATSNMYRKAYYLVAKLSPPSNFSKSPDVFDRFTVGDGATYG